jgi:beta-glucanase (GH16 family)
LHSTYHWQPNGWCGDKPSPHPHISAEIEIGETWDNALHEYAVEYTPDHIHFALDGVVFETITTANMSSSDKDRAQFFPVPYCESAP